MTNNRRRLVTNASNGAEGARRNIRSVMELFGFSGSVSIDAWEAALVRLL
jgi:hypothetical protein